MSQNFNKLNVTPRHDNLMTGRKDGKPFKLVSADIGNGTVCLVTPENEVSAPHAFRQLSGDELDALGARGDDHPFVYFVNGIPYQLGESVSANEGDKFAVRMGSERYSHDYIGAILGVLMFHGFKGDEIPMINLMMNHPPSHVMYRPQIIDATQATFLVKHRGVEKRFTVTQTSCADEPVLGYTHALMDNTGTQVAKPALLQDTYIMIDIGAFTTDLTIIKNGQPDTSRTGNQSIRFGMIDVLQRFDQNMRFNEASFFRGYEITPQHRLREAFATGTLNAGGKGTLDCGSYALQAGVYGIKSIMSGVQRLIGGIGDVDGVVLSGGGGAKASLGCYFSDGELAVTTKGLGQLPFGQLPVMYAEDDDSFMHMATSRGGRKRQLYLKHKKVLWR